jgi:hypothetical protein
MNLSPDRSHHVHAMRVSRGVVAGLGSRRPLAAMSLVLLVPTIAGCAAGAGGERRARYGGTHPVADMRTVHHNEVNVGGHVVGRPQAAILHLAAGRSRASYEIVAPSPARYVYTVRVGAPVTSTIGVHIRTWYGERLSVLASSHGEGCRPRGSMDVCVLRFPLLAAERAGAWRMIATKRSGPAADVRISVTFTRP